MFVRSNIRAYWEAVATLNPKKSGELLFDSSRARHSSEKGQGCWFRETPMNSLHSLQWARDPDSEGSLSIYYTCKEGDEAQNPKP